MPQSTNYSAQIDEKLRQLREQLNRTDFTIQQKLFDIKQSAIAEQERELSQQEKQNELNEEIRTVQNAQQQEENDVTGTGITGDNDAVATAVNNRENETKNHQDITQKQPLFEKPDEENKQVAIDIRDDGRYIAYLGNQHRIERNFTDAFYEDVPANDSFSLRRGINNALGGIYKTLAGGGKQMYDITGKPLNTSGWRNVYYDIIQSSAKMHLSSAEGGLILNNKNIDYLKRWNQLLGGEIKTEKALKELDALKQATAGKKLTAEESKRIDELEAEIAPYVTDYTNAEQSGELRTIYNNVANIAKTHSDKFEQIKANLRVIKELERQNAEYNKDVAWAQSMNNALNSIYTLPDDYRQKKESGNFWYNIPQGIGSSVSSMGTTAVNMATAAAVNAAVGAAAGSATGPGAVAAALGGAVLGMTSAVATNIYSRNLESLGEVQNNYLNNIQEYCNSQNIPIEEYLKYGREKLRKKTGRPYSEDSEDTKNYVPDDQILSDMLAYNIKFNQPDIDNYVKKQRRALQEVYDRNMSLATLDVAQDMILIPGFGKMATKAIDKLGDGPLKMTLKTAANLEDNVVDVQVRTLDKLAAKAFEKVGKKSISAAQKRFLSKYVYEPAVRLNMSSILEGFEEVKQTIIPIESQQRIDNNEDWVADRFFDTQNPENNILFNTVSEFAQNEAALFKGLLAMFGASGNPEMDNSDTFNSFMLGYVSSLFTSGALTTPSNIKNAYNYKKGQSVARRIIADDAMNKDDVTKYKAYAKYAREHNNSDQLIDGITTQLEDSAIPDGFTSDDLKQEIQYIKDVFSIPSTLKNKLRQIANTAREDKHREYIEYNPSMYETDELLDTAVALYLKSKLDYESALNAYNNRERHVSSLNDEFLNKVFDFFDNAKTKITDDSSEEQRLSAENNRNILKNYILAKARLDAFKKLQAQTNDILETAKTLGLSENQQDRFIDITLRTKDAEQAVKAAERLAKQFFSDSDISQVYEMFGGKRSVEADTVNEFLLRETLLKAEETFKDFLHLQNKANQKSVGKRILDTLQALNGQAIAIEEIIQEGTQDQDVDQQEPVALGEDATIVDDSITLPEPATIDETVGADTTEMPVADNATNTSESTLSENQSEENVLSHTGEFSTEVLPEEVQQDNDERFINYDNFLTDSQTDDSSADIDNIVAEPVVSDNEQQIEQTLVDDTEQQLPTETPDVQLEDISEVSVSEQVKIPTPEDIQKSVDIDINEQPALEESFPADMTEMFYDFSSTTPLLPGYKSGADLAKFLQKTGAIQTCLLTAKVMPTDFQHGVWDITDESTYDNAAIFVEIVAPNGDKYLTALKTVSGYENYLRKNNKYSDSAIQQYTDYRNTIIKAIIAGGEVEFKQKKQYNGTPNNTVDDSGRASHNNLTDCIWAKNGLAVESFGVGRGMANGYCILGFDGMPKPGSGGSGKIFFYVKAEDTPSGLFDFPIKLNELRFKNQDGTVNELAKSLAKACIFGVSPIEDVAVQNVLRLVLNFGKSTLINPNDKRYPFLKDKQFYIDYKNGTATLGDKRYSITDLRNDEGVKIVSEFIANNLHWNTDESVLYSEVSSVIDDFVFDNTDVITLYKDGDTQVTITKSDLKKPVIVWMCEQGVLTTDIDTQTVFNKPFIYAGQPVITKPAETVKQEAAQQAELQNPLTGADFWLKYSSEVSTDDSVQQEPNTDVVTSDVDVADEANTATDMQSSDDITNDDKKQAVNTGELQEETDQQEEKSDVDIDSKEFNEFFGFDDGPTKLVSRQQARRQKIINTAKARKWLRKALGLSDEQIVVFDGILKQFANGDVVYGQARIDGITLSSFAESGVEYHEAFHRVSLLLLSPDMRKKMYSEYRKQHPELNNVTDKHVEELLADEFMNYMLDQSESNVLFFIKKLFHDFKRFVGINNGLTPGNLRSVFSAIKYGDFKEYKLNKQAVEEFKKAYSKEGPYYKIGKDKNVTLQHFKTGYELHTALQSLAACLFLANGAKKISDIKQLSYGKLKAFLQNYIKSSHVTEQQRGALQEIIDNFETFTFELGPVVEQFGVKSLETESLTETTINDDNDIAQHIKQSFEINRKENALTAAKIFLSTLVKQHFEYVTKNGVTVKTLKTDVNDVTGLPEIISFDEAYAKAVNALYSVNSYNTELGKDQSTSLTGRCNILAETDPFFATLFRRLSGNIDLVTQTQILQTIKSFDNDFIEVSYHKNAGGIEYLVNSANGKKQIRAVISQWSANLFNSKLVNNINNVTSANSAEIRALTDEFNKLQVDVVGTLKTATEEQADLYLQKLCAMLNTAGINVNTLTLKSLLVGKNYVNSVQQMILSKASGSVQYIFTDLLPSLAIGVQSFESKGVVRTKSLLNAYNFQNENSFLYKLAENYMKYDLSSQSLQATGPGGSLIYTKSQNCYITNAISELNQHGELLEHLNLDPYCGGSIMLAAANKNIPLRVHTFINFYTTDRRDAGLDYLSLTRQQDYLAKMALTKNDMIIFPTMADKKTWYTISGCKLFHSLFNFQDDGKFQFSPETINYFYNAFKAEFNTILKYYQTLPEVKKKITNYHTSGKGGLFRHFTAIPISENGKTKWLDLNGLLAEAAKKGSTNELLDDLNKQLFQDRQMMNHVINTILQQLLKIELNTCEELGIIEKDSENGQLKNNLLSNSEIKLISEQYQPQLYNSGEGHIASAAIMTIIANHMVNQMVSTLEIEKIITGDQAFYKNANDKIKRLGAVQSTGDNLRTEWSTNVAEDQKEAARMQRVQNYTCVTLSDNNISSAQYQELVDLFTKSNFYTILRGGGLSSKEISNILDDETVLKEKYTTQYEQAKESAIKQSKLYTDDNINQADAAVYVSPEMYKNILEMLGEYNEDVEEAFRIMESTEDWQASPELYAKTLKTLIKPLKTTYFAYQFDPVLMRNVPVFNKMAMFPLFKCLANNDLHAMYERMTATGKYKGQKKIDQFAFESAVKVGIQGKFSYYTDSSNSVINDLTDLPVTVQQYKYLRRQLTTDPHTHGEVALGTQVSTLGLSNINLSFEYGLRSSNPKTGAQLVKDLYGAINAISRKQTIDVINQLTTNGELDLQKVANLLQKEGAKSAVSRSDLNLISLNKEATEFITPLSALPNSNWIEQKIASLFQNAAADIDIPGGSFIQRSSFGTKKIGVRNSRLLNILPDGSAQCIVSINLLKHCIPNYKKLSFEQQRAWLIEHNIIGEHATRNAIGYRIPTQGLCSILGVTIKDVLPENVGDTVILPDEFTAQTGSDFDIDKIFILRYSYDENGNPYKFIHKRDSESNLDYLHRFFTESFGGEYKEGEENSVVKLFESWYNDTVGKFIPIEDINEQQEVEYIANSQQACANLIIDTYLTFICDEINTSQTRVPLDTCTNYVKESILPIIFYKNVTQTAIAAELTPSYQMTKKYEFADAKNGLAPFALNNKNHAITQQFGLNLVHNALLSALGITNLSGTDSQIEQVAVRDKNFNKKIDSTTGETIMQEAQTFDIFSWMNAMINAHVDVAKDPYISKCNINMFTINVANLLFRGGFGQKTMLFLAQPYLAKLSQKVIAAQGDLLSEEISKSKQAKQCFEQIYKELVTKYMVSPIDGISVIVQGNSVAFSRNGENLNFIDLVKDNVSSDAFIDNLVDITEKQNVSKFLLQQIIYVSLFQQLLDASQNLSTFVQLCQIDTKKFGNNFVAQEIFIRKLDNFMQNQTFFEKQDVSRIFEKSFFNTILANGAIIPKVTFKDVLLQASPQFIDYCITALNKASHNTSVSNQTIKFARNAVLAQYKVSYVNDIVGVDYRSLLYGENNMAKRLSLLTYRIQEGEFPKLGTAGSINNALLAHLAVLPQLQDETFNLPYITKFDLNLNDKITIEYCKEAWQELLDDPNEDVRSFAKDLVLYAFITTGGNTTKNGIYNLLPVSVFDGSFKFIEGAESFSSFMRNRQNASAAENERISTNAILNNWWSSEIIPSVQATKEEFDPQTNQVVLSRALNNGVYVQSKNGIEIAIAFTSRKQLPPFVKIMYGKNPEDTIVYRMVGIATINNKSDFVYCAVDKLGINKNGKTVIECDNSVFEFNHVPNSIPATGEITQTLLYDTYKDIPSAQNFINTVVSRLNVYKKQEFTTPADTQLQSTPPSTLETESDTTPTVINSTAEQQAATEENSFTFNDGTKVKTPFKLNDQQKTMLLLLEQFYKSPNAFQNVVTINGFAGTGKTSTIRVFVEYLNNKFETVFFSSPTHRANAVMVANGLQNVKTLHSLFGLVPTVRLDSEFDLRNTQNIKTRTAKLKQGSWLIVDEASMIGDALYKFIHDSAIKKNCKIIFMGDPAQLPPVGSTQLSVVFNNQQAQVQLSKIERTTAGPILTEATRLREGKDVTYVSSDNGTTSVTYINQNQVKDALSTMVRGVDFKANPNSFRVLAATNKEVENANRLVRNALFGENAEDIVVGELLTGYENVKPIKNSLDVVVTSVEKQTLNLSQVHDNLNGNVVGYMCGIKQVVSTQDDAEDLPETIFIVTQPSLDIQKQIASTLQKLEIQISKALVEGEYSLANKIMYDRDKIKQCIMFMSDFVEEGRTVLKKTVGYGYAITIHKSQGGTYSQVAIHWDSISYGFDPRTQQALKYVAFTRAQHGVTVITNKKSISEKPKLEVDEDVNNLNEKPNDAPTRFASKEESVKTIKSKKTILTNEEIRQMRKFTGTIPVIAVASEHSDPVFFADSIIEVIEGKRYITDKLGRQYSGDQINGLYIITKHDGLPMQRILQTKVPKLIHFSITGLGGTKYEPNVMPYQKMLDKIKEYIDEGLDPNTVTVRIDPIVPGVTPRSAIEDIIKQAAEMGVHIRFSVMDKYSSTMKFMQNLGYDYSKYYDVTNSQNRDANYSTIKAIAEFVINTAKKYGIKEVSTCAENIDLPGVKKEACLSVSAVNNMLGTDLDLPQGRQRDSCTCYGGKVDMLAYSDKCLSGCAYCYAHHNSPLGKYAKEQIANLSMPKVKDPKQYTINFVGSPNTANVISKFCQASGISYETASQQNMQQLVAQCESVIVFAELTDENDKIVGLQRLAKTALSSAFALKKKIIACDLQYSQYFMYDYDEETFIPAKHQPLSKNSLMISTSSPLTTYWTHKINKMFNENFGGEPISKNITYVDKPQFDANDVFNNTVVIDDTAQSFANNFDVTLQAIDVHVNVDAYTSAFSYGIVTKKTNSADNRAFSDTDDEFKIFKNINSTTIKYILNDPNNEATFPITLGFNDSNMPQRFASWLAEELNSKLGTNYEIQLCSNGLGYGLIAKQKEINVYYGAGEHPELSNFADRKFTITWANGTTQSFNSVEQAFQYTKIKYYGRDENKDAVAQQIISATNPAQIKQLGRTDTQLDVQRWDKVSREIMKRLVLQSFVQNESAKKLLLDTGNAILTHNNRFGVDADGGRFSSVLTEVRSIIADIEKQGEEAKKKCKH